jgi:hypothetical protein
VATKAYEEVQQDFEDKKYKQNCMEGELMRRGIERNRKKWDKAHPWDEAHPREEVRPPHEKARRKQPLDELKESDLNQRNRRR